LELKKMAEEGKGFVEDEGEDCITKFQVLNFG